MLQTLHKKFQSLSVTGLVCSLLYSAFCVLILGNSFSCEPGVLVCNRMLFAIGAPVYVLFTVFLSTIPSAVLVLSFLMTSVTYTIMVYYIGKTISQYIKKELTKIVTLNSKV